MSWFVLNCMVELHGSSVNARTDRALMDRALMDQRLSSQVAPESGFDTYDGNFASNHSRSSFEGRRIK